jgi:hypothetical protein
MAILSRVGRLAAMLALIATPASAQDLDADAWKWAQSVQEAVWSKLKAGVPAFVPGSPDAAARRKTAGKRN